MTQDIRRPPPDSYQNFGQALAGLEGGALHTDLTEAMSRLVREMHDAELNGANKVKGSLTLTLAMTLSEGIMEIRADYKTRAPRLPRRRSVLFVANGDFLSPRNPAQPDLPFRTVEGEARVIRSPDDGATNTARVID